jgi:ABC-type Na+ transport system ATPase subunit NatA
MRAGSTRGSPVAKTSRITRSCARYPGRNSTRALRRLLLHLRDAGKCIVISSHIMQEVEQLADEVVIVAQGRTVAHGSADAIRAQAGTPSLEDAFVRLAYEPGHDSRAEAR